MNLQTIIAQIEDNMNEQKYDEQLFQEALTELSSEWTKWKVDNKNYYQQAIYGQPMPSNDHGSFIRAQNFMKFIFFLGGLYTPENKQKVPSPLKVEDIITLNQLLNGLKTNSDFYKEKYDNWYDVVVQGQALNYQSNNQSQKQLQNENSLECLRINTKMIVKFHFYLSFSNTVFNNKINEELDKIPKNKRPKIKKLPNYERLTASISIDLLDRRVNLYELKGEQLKEILKKGTIQDKETGQEKDLYDLLIDAIYMMKGTNKNNKIQPQTTLTSGALRKKIIEQIKGSANQKLFQYYQKDTKKKTNNVFEKIEKQRVNLIKQAINAQIETMLKKINEITMTKETIYKQENRKFFTIKSSKGTSSNDTQTINEDIILEAEAKSYVNSKKELLVDSAIKQSESNFYFYVSTINKNSSQLSRFFKDTRDFDISAINTTIQKEVTDILNNQEDISKLSQKTIQEKTLNIIQNELSDKVKTLLLEKYTYDGASHILDGLNKEFSNSSLLAKSAYLHFYNDTTTLNSILKNNPFYSSQENFQTIFQDNFLEYIKLTENNTFFSSYSNITGPIGEIDTKTKVDVFTKNAIEQNPSFKDFLQYTSFQFSAREKNSFSHEVPADGLYIYPDIDYFFNTKKIKVQTCGFQSKNYASSTMEKGLYTDKDLIIGGKESENFNKERIRYAYPQNMIEKITNLMNNTGQIYELCSINNKDKQKHNIINYIQQTENFVGSVPGVMRVVSYVGKNSQKEKSIFQEFFPTNACDIIYFNSFFVPAVFFLQIFQENSSSLISSKLIQSVKYDTISNNVQISYNQNQRLESKFRQLFSFTR